MNSTTIGYRETHSLVQVVLTATAVSALLVGAAVYLLDRDWASTMLLEPFARYQWLKFAIFGSFGEFLPSYLHAYAITVLLIVALWPWPRIKPWACLLWFILASLLEWLQSDGAYPLILSVDRLKGDIPFLEYLVRYAVLGQFDNADLLATGFGCLTALVVTTAVVSDRQRNLT